MVSQIARKSSSNIQTSNKAIDPKLPTDQNLALPIDRPVRPIKRHELLGNIFISFFNRSDILIS